MKKLPYRLASSMPTTVHAILSRRDSLQNTFDNPGKCRESRHWRYLSRVLGDGKPGSSARAFLFAAPVVAGGVDVMGGQDFPGPEFDDGGAGGVGDSEDFLPRWAMPTPRWCMRPARVDADLAAGVDVVIAQPVVGGRGGGGSAPGSERGGLRQLPAV